MGLRWRISQAKASKMLSPNVHLAPTDIGRSVETFPVCCRRKPVKKQDPKVLKRSETIDIHAICSLLDTKQEFPGPKLARPLVQPRHRLPRCALQLTRGGQADPSHRKKIQCRLPPSRLRADLALMDATPPEN
jgi:hypothetical protein